MVQCVCSPGKAARSVALSSAIGALAPRLSAATVVRYAYAEVGDWVATAGETGLRADSTETDVLRDD